MIEQWLSRRYDMERVRDIAQRLGIALVFAGTVGLFVTAVGIWPPLAIIVVGLVLIDYGITKKA